MAGSREAGGTPSKHPVTAGPEAPYLEPGKIGSLTLRNRLVRASTSETMAAPDGAGTSELANLYGVHDGFDPLRCWRTGPAAHIYTRHIRGRLPRSGRNSEWD